MTNIYIVVAYGLVLCGYFYIGFIDFMLNNANLFFQTI